VGTPDQPDVAPERLPQLFDPTQQYREMGLIAQGGAIPVIGTMRVLAGSSPDTLRTLIALSLRNRGFTFRREGEAFLGEYRVEVTLQQGTEVVRRLSRDEQVRVATFRETQRSDESIIYQQFLPTAPGSYTVSITVRDRNGPAVTRIEAPFTVPSFSGSSMSLPIAVYTAGPRSSVADVPALVVNARGSAGYGTDTLKFYLETYNLPVGQRLFVSAYAGPDNIVWADTVVVDSQAPVRSHVVSIPPQVLSIGRYELHASLGTRVDAVMPFLVTFSDLYAVANLEEIVSLLRYLPEADSLRAILNAPAAERAAAWQRFWRRSDPNPATPENETIDNYLTRVQVANTRFRDEGVPGWMTERGEVLIVLGEPNEYYDRRPEVQRGRDIIWTYYEYRISLRFVDDGGFGRFRLDPRSRSDFHRIVNQLARQ